MKEIIDGLNEYISLLREYFEKGWHIYLFGGLIILFFYILFRIVF